MESYSQTEPRKRPVGSGMLVLLLLTACVFPRLAGADQSETVRVGLYFGDSAPHSVTVKGPADWKSARTKERLESEFQIRAVKGELIVSPPGEKSFSVGRWLSLSPLRPSEPLVLDNTAYRGRLLLQLLPPDRVKVINILEMEDYLQGVVPNEMFTHPEAFAVQAIISRTVALFIRDHQRRHALADGFDLCAVGNCQFYRGATSEKRLGNEAVQRTRGQILTYREAVILAAYHANSGGMTAETDEAWPGSLRLAYLSPVPSPYDDVAADLDYPDCFHWTIFVTQAHIREQVRRYTRRDVGEVKHVVVTQSWPSGRAKELKVVGSRRNAVLWRPTDIRRVLGLTLRDTGKSYDYDTRSITSKRSKGGFTIRGYGAGEGVGLSQQGAFGMARAGFGHREILGHYYRGVALTEDYGRGKSQPLPPIADPLSRRSSPETLSGLPGRFSSPPS